MENDDEIFHVFLEESAGLLEEVYEILKKFADDKPEAQAENVNAVYRCIHTIKGGASMLELPELTDITHVLESHLSELKKTPEKFDVAFITRQIDQIDEIISNLNKKSGGKNIDQKQTKSAPQAKTEPSKTLEKENSDKNSLKKTPPNLIKVPLDRIQRSYDLTSEIFLLRNQIAHLLEVGSDNGIIQNELFLKLEVLDNSLRQRIVELESAVLSMRMTSVKSLFSRMEKTIRTYSDNSEKEIKVNITGEETEIDKRILDSLGDAMIHLIRNAMDHGIEMPDEREKAHKPRHGTISMDAKIIGNEVVLRIHDDGKGIDANEILKSAKNKGLDISSVITQEDALQLIFAPGFSTAEKVSEVSGRGVGMDVVKTYVEKSGGKINIDTKVGIGTIFSLHLPIGLSIIPLIVVRVGKHIYGIPTHDIVQTYTLSRKDITVNHDQHLLNIDGQFIKCIFLSNCFENTNSNDHIMRRDIFVCLAEVGGQLCAFIADKLIANTELIVKALSPGVPALPYLQGVSILTTGIPAFILSLEKLHKRITRQREGTANGI